MSLTLPIGSMVNFQTGTISSYNNLPLSSKAAKTIYLIDDNNKFYLYSGSNPIYSKIDIATSVTNDSNLPVSSQAVYNYVATAFEVIDNSTTNISDGDMQPGHFYYTDNGTLKFKYGLGYAPLKIATGEGFILSSPISAQTIDKDLTLSSGNLTLTEGKILTVDIIQKASTNSSNKITLNGNSAVSGSLTISSDLTASNITATNITANTLLKTNNLTAEGTITGLDINITNGFITEADSNSKKWVTMKSALSFDFNHTYYIDLNGAASLYTLNTTSSATFGSTLSTTGKATLGSLEVSGAANIKSTLVVEDATTLSNTITTNYFSCTLNSGSVADKMTMLKPLYFGSNYYINTSGAGNLASLIAGSATISNDLTISGNLALTKIDNAYNFGGQSFSTILEGVEDTQSGSEVTGVVARLVYGGQQVLTKADLTATNGLIKTSLDTLSNTTNTLNTTVNNNKTISDEMIIIAANIDGAAPASVTSNTKIWIDTTEGNGLVKIKTTDGTWVPVSSVWT